jgi:hypothetical protein
MGLESIKTSISSVTGAIAPVGSQLRYGDIDPTNNATDALVDRGDPDAGPGYVMTPNPINSKLAQIGSPLRGIGTATQSNPFHTPVSIRTPPPSGGINPQAPKAESQGPTKTTSPQPSPRQAAINSLAKTMADDARQSPQKAIDKGAVDQAGKVTPNKLEPAVKKELTKLVEDFRKNSADFSKTIKGLGEKIKNDNNADDNFKKAYDDFKDKYDKNFVEEKDLLNEGFNAKEVIDSFQKAHEASKGTSYEKAMDGIKKDIIDKYLKPMDSLARGDQGPALVARDKMKESLTKENGAIVKLKQAGKNNEQLNSALDALNNKIKEHNTKSGKIDLKEETKAIEQAYNNLPVHEKRNAKASFEQVKQASDIYGKMNDIAFPEITKDKDGKDIIDEVKLGFDVKEASQEYLNYMQTNHQGELRDNLREMSQQSEMRFDEKAVDEATEEKQKESSILIEKDDIIPEEEEQEIEE